VVDDGSTDQTAEICAAPMYSDVASSHESASGSVSS